jgi:hypothetical protein
MGGGMSVGQYITYIFGAILLVGGSADQLGIAGAAISAGAALMLLVVGVCKGVS